MLIVLRILFGAIFLHFARLAWLNAERNPAAGDLENAFYTAICVVLALANAMVWAPYIGSKLSDPLTSTVTQSTFVDQVNYLMKLAQWLARRGWRRTVLLLAFLEGIRRPHTTVPFIIGFQQARPGSWLEKVFAREVYRFQNIQNCIKAYQVLKAHGRPPGAHPNAEVSMAILALEKEAREPSPKYKLPPAAPRPRLLRNRRIVLFEMDKEEAAAEAEQPAAEAPAGISAPPVEPVQETEASPSSPVQPDSFWLRWYGKVAVWRERR